MLSGVHMTIKKKPFINKTSLNVMFCRSLRFLNHLSVLYLNTESLLVFTYLLSTKPEKRISEGNYISI